MLKLVQYQVSFCYQRLLGGLGEVKGEKTCRSLNEVKSPLSKGERGGCSNEMKSRQSLGYQLPENKLFRSNQN